MISHLCNADEGATKVAKFHITNLLKGDFEELSNSYSKDIQLMPGHEFLKKRYKLSKDGDRSKSITIPSHDLIASMIKSAEGRPKKLEEQIEALHKSLKYELVKTPAGDFAIEPADPVATPDKMLHFTIKKDDVLLKIGPPEGDYLLLHLREINGKWKVVSEYLD